MFPTANHTNPAQTTPAKLVLPFYLYAALSFLTATILLLISVKDFTGHFFNPHILAVTHIMALGWCTMIILGASHQLVPVIIEGCLYSPFLAMSSFILAAIGIPLLVYGFYQFNMGWPAKLGGILIVLALLSYAVNLGLSISKSGKESVQSSFILSASLWLLITTIVGLLLVYNFTIPLLQRNSVEYLSFHAHIGIVGWFLLLVIGVGSRLIPMFLISKYQNNGILWWIFGLVNSGLLAFAGFFLYNGAAYLFFIPLFMILAGLFLFIYYCYQAYRERIRKKVDDPMKLSLVSILLLALPALVMIVLLGMLTGMQQAPSKLVMAYGFLVFFGWLTALILGMTFKTLPFIIWNKVYHRLLGKVKAPNPRELFNDKIVQAMLYCFFAGLGVFFVGILWESVLLLRLGGILLLVTAILYNWNVLYLLNHKAQS